MPDFRVAIVGAGYTAREHLRAFQPLPGVTVAGLFSRTRARAEKLAGEFKVPLVADSVKELYEKTKADLVVVTVVELSMNPVCKACFEFPWKLLVEKPPGHNLPDALDIQSAAKQKGRTVFVALNRRFIGTTRQVLAGLAGDASPRYIRVQDQENPEAARAAGQPAQVVENWMYANSIHMVDYLRVFGRGDISAVERIQPWTPASPGIVVARIRFSSGDVGLYEAIWGGPGPWAVAVTAARRRWELRPLEKLETQELGGPKTLPDPHPWDAEFKPGFRAQAEAAVAGKGVTLDDAVGTMRLISEIYTP